MKFRKFLSGQLALILAALFWGIAFVAQSDAADKIGTFSFIFLRFLIGSVVLLPVIALLDAADRKKTGDTRSFFRRFADKKLLTAGILCGAVLFAASSCQQLGLVYGTTSGKCAFITAMYMIFTPLAGLFMKKAPGPVVWIGVALSVTGMYFLCIHGAVTLCAGDLLVLCAALLYTVHILTLDHFVQQVDCVRLACLQFFVTSLIGLAVMLPTETLTWGIVTDAAIPILYVGIFSSGVAYTLQIVGQKNCPAAIAPLLMSLESVFAALAGWAFGVEKLSRTELLGCGLIFAAVILIQIPFGSLRKKNAVSE